MAWWLLPATALVVGFSLWLRVENRRSNDKEPDSRTSPLSIAIQELVATAGGIYLAVIALTSFLRLDLPEKVTLCAVSMDPLAVGAIGAAIIQPFVARAFNNRSR